MAKWEARRQQPAISPELQLVVLACRTRVDGDARVALQTHLETVPLNWGAVLGIATKNKVRPVVYQSLRQAASKNLPPELMETWKAQCQEIARFNLDNAREQLRLLRGLQNAGLTAIPYRGLYMGAVVYGDPGLRETTDIDLFIRLEELPRLKAALKDMGYLPHHQFTPASERAYLQEGFEYKFDRIEDGCYLFHLEAHWMPANRRYAMAVHLEDIDEHLIATEINGLPVQAFSPELLLLQLVMHHGGLDQWRYLKFVCDLAYLIETFRPSFNWDVMLAEARRLGLLGLCYNGLALAEALLGTSLPPEVEWEARRAKYQRLAREQIQRLELGQRPAVWKHGENTRMILSFHRMMLRYHLVVRERWADRLRVLWGFLLQIILPNPEQIQYSGLGYPWYYLLVLTKPFRLLRRHWKI